LQAGNSARCLAVLLLPVALAACSGTQDARSISFTDNRGVADQPYPSNYRSEILALMRIYLNNPVGVREAAMAEPVQRAVGGRLRYVSCLRYASREADGTTRGVGERAVIYIDGRLDRIAENASELCAGSVYASFPELEKLVR